MMMIIILTQKSSLMIFAFLISDTALQRISGLLRLRELNFLSTKAFKITASMRKPSIILEMIQFAFQLTTASLVE
jgi:hypothetical protein